MTDRRQGWRIGPVVWFVAAGATLPLSLLVLVLGLSLPSLALVYLSILFSVLSIPFVIVGLVQIVGSRSTSP